MYQKDVLSQAEVQKALEAIMKEAAKSYPQGAISVAVVDDRGDLLAFSRMDGVGLLTVGIATRKAYTSAVMGLESGAVGEMMKSFGIDATNIDPQFVTFQGGVPIKHPKTGAVLGGIGVSGLQAHEDEALAKVGLAAMGL